MPKTSTIAVFRGNDIWMDRNRVYKISIDGNTVGELWPNQRGAYLVTPGLHRIRVKIDFMKSNELSAEVSDGETLELTCLGHGSLSPFFNTFFRRNAYLDLQPKSSS